MALKYIARFVSYVFHPLFGLTYALLLVMWVNPYGFGSSTFQDTLEVNDVLVLQIFITTALLPGFAALMMKMLGLIDSLEMKDKQERIGPYMATVVFYIWIYMTIRSNPNLPLEYKTFVLGASIALALAFFINLFTKISMHTTAMGGILGFAVIGLFIYAFPNFVGLTQIILLTAGVVGTARLLLDAHEPNDVYAGYAVGFLAQFVALQLG